MDIRHGAQVWPAYINSAQELLSNAAIMYDRFHLIMYGNRAIDQVLLFF
jgi:transposase